MKDDRVRSLGRGLEILQLVNHHISLKASEVARLAKVPRPTAYRLLETLQDLGYLTRSASDGRWRPTLQVRTLSSGFRDEDWVAQIAMPRMVALGRQVLWPLDLVSFSDFRMVVRESTHALSPYSIDHGMVGRGLPILDTAGGRAYLAYLEPQERRALLDRMIAHATEDHPLLHDPAGMEHMISRCRAYGLGYRAEGFNPHTKSLSAPILANGRVVSCLTIVWISSALKFEEGLETFSEPLKACAADIAAALAP